MTCQTISSEDMFWSSDERRAEEGKDEDECCVVWLFLFDLQAQQDQDRRTKMFLACREKFGSNVQNLPRSLLSLIYRRG